MKESTKRLIDWLTLPFLGYAIVAAFGFHLSLFGHVLLIFDLPFVLAAIAWLGWRFLSSQPPLSESTKRVIDWLTLPFFAYLPAALLWAYYTHTTHPPKIWVVLWLTDGLLVATSVMWLLFRGKKVKIVDWFERYIVSIPSHWFVPILILGISAGIALIHWLWS